MKTIGILLAAGDSKRFGSDKRRAELADGRSMLATSLSNLAPAVDHVIIAVRQREDWIAPLLSPTIECLEISHTQGLGDTLSAAVEHAEELAADGVIITLADMPWLRTETVKAVAKLLTPTNLVVPRCKQQWGHPTGFSRDYFADLKTCQGERGARWLLTREKGLNRLVELDIDDPAILLDVDTTDQLCISALI